MVNLKEIQVEVVLKIFKPQLENSVQQSVLLYLKSITVFPGTAIKLVSSDIVLNELVEFVIIEDIPNYQDPIDFSAVKIKWLFYCINYSTAVTQNEYSSDEEIDIATHLVLPNINLVNVWENLYYDNDVKNNLLQYAHMMMKFSDSGVDGNIITCNKVILLHGPPGTGKTSLCKALAQKLTIRMQNRYSSGLFIEVNSHSLFSKYFSESGKLVTKMFSNIREVIENRNNLVCVLIDEVESIAHARDQCMSGVEPSDSIRVVNAVLTQIDQIRTYPNVLILATSNLTKSIDLAFIDRADIKQYLGLPKFPAIYKIYLSCLQELQRVDILEKGISFEPLASVLRKNNQTLDKHSSKLLEICKISEGLSGRALRKIPFIAKALYSDNDSISMEKFLISLEIAVNKEKNDRANFNMTSS